MLTKTKSKLPHKLLNINLNELIKQLLQEMNQEGSQITASAYDTAWVARLAKKGEAIGIDALEWLRSNQLDDGSWGCIEPLYFHDRVICTLSAIIALSMTEELEDQYRIQKALPTLMDYSTKLELDPAGETIAFEMLFPSLMSEAKKLGIIPQGSTGKLNNMVLTRTKKLANSPGSKISRLVTLAFSSEMAGADGLHILDTENLQEPNGSIGYSPAATVHFLNYVSSDGNLKALQYLKDIAKDGGFPNVTPFEIYEKSWVLWNLTLANILDEDIKLLSQQHLNDLENAWVPGLGIGFSKNYMAKDSDETSVTFEVFSRTGRPTDITAVLNYEEEEYFRCYEIEANPSISANIHILSALREAGLGVEDKQTRKARDFLEKKRTKAGYWFDKWHASPYYSTTHAIIACAGYDNKLVKNAVSWIINTQNSDGSWGYYVPTAEETAYCIQALIVWKKYYGTVPFGVIERGVYWLAKHMNPPYPPLWICKSLYSPILIIRSAILSALILASQNDITYGKNGVNSCKN